MKNSLALIPMCLVIVLGAKAVSAEKQPPKIVLQPDGIIPMSTPAFDAYALTTLLDQANFVARAWNLDVPLPIRSNHVTRLVIRPKTNGLSGSIRVSRYDFGVGEGRFSLLRDNDFSFRMYLYNDEKSDALATMTNVLKRESALALARDKLHRIGIDAKQIGLGEPVECKQWKYDSNGVVFPMPYYKVRWQATNIYLVVDMGISGVTSNVAEFNYNIPADSLPQSLRVPTPTNYFQMLGLPPNIKFVPHDHERRERWKHQAQPEPLPLLN